MKLTRPVDAALLAPLGLALLSGTADATVTTFASRAAFEAAAIGQFGAIVTEDFDSAHTSGGFNGPLNASTSNAVFQLGDIDARLEFRSTFDPSGIDFFVGAPGAGFGNTTPVLGANSSHQQAAGATQTVHQIDLLNGTSAIGFDLQTGIPASSVANVTVYGLDDTTLLLSTSFTAGSNPTFFGAISDAAMGPIGLVEFFADPDEPNFFGLDNVTFEPNAPLAPTADANGPYTFDAATLSVDLDGSGSVDPNSNIATLQWDNVDGTDVGTVAFPAVLLLSIVDSGLTMTTSSGTVEVTATDATNLQDSATASISYDNALPSVDGKTATELADFSFDFTALFGDPDFIVGSTFATLIDFEQLVASAISFGLTDLLTGSGTNLSGNVSRADLEAALGATAAGGVFTLTAKVTDKAGDMATMDFDITLSDRTGVPVPEPASLWLLGLGIAALRLARQREGHARSA